MSAADWTPRTIANGILYLAAGLMLLAALGLGAISGGSWLWTKATAPKVQIQEFADTGPPGRDLPPGFIPRRATP